jgi:putative hydrolase
MRFSELGLETTNVENHVHTIRTDGKATVEEILRVAEERGLGSVAFTEHVRADTDWFSGFAEEVRETAVRFPLIKVRVGCEAKALDADGTLDVSDSILAESDLVLGSVHRIPNGRGGFFDFRAMPSAELADVEQRFALGLLKSAPIDVLAHPGGMYQRFKGPFPADYFQELLNESVRCEVAVEISSSYLRAPETFLDLCAELNPRVSIGSDVHELRAIGSCRDMVRSYLKRQK